MWRMRTYAALWLLWSTLCPGARAAESLYTLQPDAETRFELKLPAPPLSFLVFEQHLYVALGTHGVAIFELSADPPVLARTLPLDGEVIQVLLVNGQPAALVRVVVVSPLERQAGEAAFVPLTTGAASSAASGTRQAEAASEAPARMPEAASSGRAPSEGGPRPLATVLELGPGTAVVDAGRNHGLMSGDIVRLLTPVPLSKEEQALERGELSTRLVETGRGQVKASGLDRSHIVLLRGSRAAVGDRVERLPATDRPRMTAPDRLGDVKELSITLRPFLGVGVLGFGSISDLSFTWYSGLPFFVDARIYPLRLGAASGVRMAGTTLLLSGGYDNRYFAIGLGLGGSLTDAVLDYSEYENSSNLASYTTKTAEGLMSLSGFTLGQVARLGARDGLHIALRNGFNLASGSGERTVETCTFNTDECSTTVTDIEIPPSFVWSYTQGKLVIPVALPTNIFLEAGGGPLGFFHVEGGIQTWLRGNGDRGSLGLSAGAGYGHLIQQAESSVEAQTLRGPLVSFSMQRRW